LANQLLEYAFLAGVGAGLAFVVEIWAIISEGSLGGPLVSCTLAEPRRRRPGGCVFDLSNLELLLVFGSNVVASPSEAAKRRVINQGSAGQLNV
jgi:hypothetical protein